MALPHLGHEAVYEAINRSKFLYDRGDVRTTIENHSIAATRLAVFLCPSDRTSAREFPGNSYRCNVGVKSTYFAVVDASGPHGAFDQFRSVRQSEFVDGVSKTILMSERLIGSYAASSYDATSDIGIGVGVSNTAATADFYRSFCPNPPLQDLKFESTAGALWIVGGYRSTWHNCILGPNSEVPDCASSETTLPENALVGARSMHPASVNVLLADGACRAIDENIELAIWQALATRDSAETTNERRASPLLGQVQCVNRQVIRPDRSM